MKLISVFIISLLFPLIPIKGQNNNATPALRIGANFYSESFWMSDGVAEGEDDFNSYINNNGWNIEGQYTLLSHQSKEKEGRKVRGSEVLNIGVNGYFYGIENQSSNTIITGDLTLEKEFFFGLQLFGKVGMGVLNTKLIADVYSVSPDGTVTENNNFSNQEIVLPSSFGLGWNFESLINIPICLRARTMHFTKSFGPYSTYKAGVLFGLEYKFKNVNVSPIKEF